jgi:hypothetical protein
MAQVDPFKAANVIPTYPSRRAQAVDISSTDFTPEQVTKALYVGVAGDVVAILADNLDPVTFKGMPVGLHALQIKTVVKTGTGATNMVALFG